MGFDFHTHGLWILGSITIFIATLTASQIDWSYKASETGFVISGIISLVFFMISGVLWISAASNSRS